MFEYKAHPLANTNMLINVRKKFTIDHKLYLDY